MGRKRKQLPTDTFGQLTLIRETDIDILPRTWLCQCKCGNTTEVVQNNLVSGRTQSCGCGQIAALTSHGLSTTRLYSIHEGIIQRTTNPKNINFIHYGKRGITMHEEWRKDFLSFYTWAINNGYAANLTIERLDNNKGYTPLNCSWVSMATQANNRRGYSKKTASIFKGVYYNKANKNWRSIIQYKGKRHEVGSFATEQEAHEQRLLFIKQHNLDIKI